MIVPDDLPADHSTTHRITVVVVAAFVAVFVLWAPGAPTRYVGGGYACGCSGYFPGSTEAVDFGLFGYYTECRPARPGRLSWIANMLNEPASSRYVNEDALCYTGIANFAVFAVAAWKLRPRRELSAEESTPPSLSDPELSP